MNNDTPKLWSDGILLLGRFNRLRAGSWILAHRGESAILDAPPHDGAEISPAQIALRITQQEGMKLKYFFGSHCHADHFSQESFTELMNFFPQINAYLQRGFRPRQIDVFGGHGDKHAAHQ